MLRRFLLVIVVLPVLLLAGALLACHLRGGSQLRAELARLRQAGESLDIRRLAPPPVAPASNGLPLLLASQRRLAALSDAPLPGSHEFVAPGVAVPPTRIDLWGETSRRTNSWTNLYTLHSRLGPAFEDLQEALAFPFRRADKDWSQGVNLTFPALGPMKSATVALGASALIQARRGDFTNALADLLDARVLEQDLAADPLLIDHLVRIAISSITTSRTWAVLHAHDWTEEQLGALQESVTATNLVEGLVGSLRGERAWVMQELTTKSARQLAELFENSGGTATSLFGNPAPHLDFPEGLEAATDLAEALLRRLGEGFRTRILFPLWHFAFGRMSIARYLRISDEWIRTQDRAARVHSLRVVEDANLERLLEPESLGDRVANFIPRMILPALAKASSRAFRVEVEASLTRTAIALRRFQLRHARLPEALAELVPAFLPSLPIDGMDGQPLRYRRESTNQFRLWSIGEDGTDDGGDAAAPQPGRQSRTWWQGRDTVWPRAATTEEIASWHRSIEEQEALKRSRGTAPGTNVPAYHMSPELMQRYGLLPAQATPATPGPPPPPPVVTPDAPRE